MMIHFIRPFWLYLFIPAIIYLGIVIYCYRQNNHPWKSVCDAHLLPRLLQSSSTTSRVYFNIILSLFFIVTLFALAGPAWKKEQRPIYREINSVIVVLDLSPAMLATDLKPDRLTRAKLKIRDLIHSAPNTQMGLVVFTEEAFVVSPLSQDANTLDAMLDELNLQMMPVSGSDIGQGIKQGLDLLKQAGVEQSNLLLITASEPTASSWATAKSLSQSGHHLNVLAMLESNSSTQMTLNKLQQLAKMSGGSLYLFTPDSQDIQTILNSHNTKQAIKEAEADNVAIWQDAGPWFCLLIIPFALVLLTEKVRREKFQ